MQLYLISYEHFFEGEAKLVSDLFQSNEFTFHLRKPGAALDEYKAFLNKTPEKLHHKIMLHDAFDLIQKFKVKGLHFSTKNRHLKSNYEGCYCSTSSHSLQEVVELEQQFDYQFLSPVFTSISKPRYKGNLNLTEIKNYLKGQRSGKVVALGGITENNIEKLHQIGFDGVAVLGRVWGNNPQTDINISKRFNDIYTCINHAHIA